MASSNSAQRTQAGVLLGGSPLEGLTLHGLVGRDAKGRFAPWLAAQWAFLGGGRADYALALFGQYKAEGLTEAGGEAEGGLLSSWRSGSFILDAGLIAGAGVEEEEVGEFDAEQKLRAGFALVGPVRGSLVLRVRERVAGERPLSGGRTWDALGGPELLASLGPLALAASGGPTTVGVSQGLGAYGMLSVALYSGL
jgi:hypothetical protein